MLVYHTSDLHDRRAFAAGLRRLRAAEPGLLVDSGDALRGSQTVYRRREPILDELAAAAYDVQAMGNREFHYLLPCVRARARRMAWPLLCANLVDRFGRALPFRREHVLARPDGGRVRFFGLLAPQYPEGSPWERLLGWRFLDPTTVAREVAATATSEETLVLLSHLGLDADRRLAAAVPRLDAILGGHSHDTLREPERVGGVPIVHAGPYGRLVSRNRFEGRRLVDSALLPLLAAP